MPANILPSCSNESEIKNGELLEIYNNFLSAMNEDFNTSLALVEFNKINKIIYEASILLLLQHIQESLFHKDHGSK